MAPTCRTLAADIGTALGGGAHLRNLRRTAVGGFDLAGAVPLEQLTPEAVRPPADAVAHLPSVAVGDEVAADVAHGKVLPLDRLGATGDGPWAVLDGRRRAARGLPGPPPGHRQTRPRPPPLTVSA